MEFIANLIFSELKPIKLYLILRKCSIFAVRFSGYKILYICFYNCNEKGQDATVTKGTFNLKHR